MHSSGFGKLRDNTKSNVPVLVTGNDFTWSAYPGALTRKFDLAGNTM
jgi:hypothetical protein